MEKYVYKYGGDNMKAIIKSVFFLMIMLIIIAFSGCTSIDLDAESLLEPPSLAEEQEKLNEALSDVIGEDYKLIYPSNGSYNSAFMFYDIDSDDEDEALAFYSIDNESTRMNILKCDENGNWISVYEAAGSSGDVDSVNLVDLGDGEYSIVVKWSSEVGVYSFLDNKLKTKYLMSCDGIYIGDISGDGFDDIVLFGGSYLGRSNARILCYYENELVETNSVYLNAKYNDIYNFVIGDLGNGHRGIFVDSKIYDNIYLTEVISLRDDYALRYTIADFIPEEEEEIEGSTIITLNYGVRGIYARNTKAKCEDIDNDGIIEFPVEYRNDTASESDDRLFFIQYMKYNGNDTSVVWTGFTDPESGFMVTLPESWIDEIVISKNSASGEFIFSKYHDGNEVLRIHAINEKEYQDIFDDRYELVLEKFHTKYYAAVTSQENDQYYIEPDTLSQRFRLI